MAPCGGRADAVTARVVLAAVALSVGVRLDADPDRWVEVRSAHFTVRSDAGGAAAARVARRFESFRAALRQLWPWARVDPAEPIAVYAARSEASLRELLPSFWDETPGGRPAGVFLSRGGRSIVVLRTDVPVPRPGEGSPFHVLYHEYTHLVLDLNFESLPPWLHEGLAEFLGATMIEGDGIEIGRPIPSHLLLLRERRLMPTADLLGVSRSSPGYSEGDRASLFYAQSWALVHCLMEAWPEGGGRIGEYLELRRDGVDDDEASRRVLGDPRELHRTLEGYVRGRIHHRRLSVRLRTADEPSAARVLSPPEVLATRGELLLVAERETQARLLFERALAVDSSNASAREGLDRLTGTTRLPPRTGPDDPDAVLERRCDRGVLADCVELGDRFRRGKAGHQKDLARAAALFVAACAAGAPLACAREGWAYESGEGVPRDPARAAVVHSRACDAGDDWSCTRLGLLHERGQGVSKDDARALRLFTAACDHHFAPGCTRRGVAHLSRGSAGELEEAASWLLQGCDGGDAEGCGLLAALHETGQGVLRDPPRAAELHRKACAGGFAPSCPRARAIDPAVPTDSQ